MPRLYLILFLAFLSNPGFGQNNLSKYLDFAQEQFDKGDYYYALEYYEKAMQIDSTTIDILWRVAETHRAYKDYRKAEYYYAKVYDGEEAQIYPYSLLQLGLMQKQNGKYTEAIETFKKAKKKYYKDKRGYLYLKSKQELISTLWAQSAIDEDNLLIEQLPETVNTKNSEFGHGIYGNQLLFSSLRADSISDSEEVYEPFYKTRIYRSVIDSGTYAPSELVKDLFQEELNSGNGAFSLDSTRFYFSTCKDEGYNYRCKIVVAQYNNGKWFAIDTLGEIVNEPEANTTMPCIAEIDGQEALVFASDRKEGEGGLDLYITKIKNGNQYSKVRPLKSLNTPDNEVTPWWDAKQQRLYFSSSWHEGFGGLDVFYSSYDGDFAAPINAGRPLNSPANDLYLFKQEDTCYVTSNRLGVLYSKNPTCCSDIFAVKPPKIELPPTKAETLADLNKRLPVTLYFHNDVPNPKSRDTLTSLNYMQTYEEYTAMLETYKKEYSNGLKGEKSEEAKEDIEDFFIEYVDQGVADLALFRDLLLEELQRGAKINITVKGFASPLAKTDYNVNLTKRRISSLVNYMRAYDNGIFVPYLNATAANGGKVVFSQIPFGEYTANQLTSDNPNDVQNSVYSRSAAIERKIEIQSVSYLEEEKEFALTTPSPVFDAKNVKKGTTVKASFTVTNASSEPIELGDVRIPSSNVSVDVQKTRLAPGESVPVLMEVKTGNLARFFVESIYISTKNSDLELRLYVSGQIAEE